MDVKDKCALVQLQRKADDNAKIAIEETWRRPDQGWVKINFDAAYSEESSSGAWGARAEIMLVMLCSAWDTILHCLSAEMGEAVACLESVKLATSLTTGGILLQTDCYSLLKVFDPSTIDRSPVSLIAKEFHRVKPEGRKIQLVYVSRKVNGVAHKLAQHRRRELCRGVMQSYAPTCVRVWNGFARM
jgi:hypothetical protein